MSLLTLPNPLQVPVVGERAEGDTRPSRSAKCAYCGLTLEGLPGGPWTVSRSPGNRNPECAAQPGEDRYGPHAPGAPIVHPPARTAEV